MPDGKAQGEAKVIPGEPGGPFAVELVRDGWHVHADVEIHHREPVIAGISVRPLRKLPAGGLQLKRLREAVSYTALNKAIAEHLASQAPPMVPLGEHANAMTVRRPGRRGHPPVFYIVWSERYVRLCETGETDVYVVLADRYPDHEGVTPAYVESVLERAVELDLLERWGSQAGRAGGRLTPKAKKAIGKLRVGLVPGEPQKNEPTPVTTRGGPQ